MNFPKREHYDSFVNRLVEGVSSTDCLYIYGSFTRNKDFVPGRSDIDGGFVFDDEFVTSKVKLLNLSRFLDICLIETELEAGLSYTDPGVSLNFNLMDRAINRDGRFLAYDDSYTDYLKENARVVAGRDLVQEMNGMNYKRESLRSAAYNLRKVRNGLLTYFADLKRNPQKARKTVLSSMNVLWNMPKKLLENLGKDLEFGQNAFFDTFKEVFPEYDPASYEEVLSLRRDPNSFFNMPENLSLAFNHSLIFLTATEQMIQAYVQKFPLPSQLEVRSTSI